MWHGPTVTPSPILAATCVVIPGGDYPWPCNDRFCGLFEKVTGCTTSLLFVFLTPFFSRASPAYSIVSKMAQDRLPRPIALHAVGWKHQVFLLIVKHLDGCNYRCVRVLLWTFITSSWASPYILPPSDDIFACRLHFFFFFKSKRAAGGRNSIVFRTYDKEEMHTQSREKRVYYFAPYRHFLLAVKRSDMRTIRKAPDLSVLCIPPVFDVPWSRRHLGWQLLSKLH